MNDIQENEPQLRNGSELSSGVITPSGPQKKAGAAETPAAPAAGAPPAQSGSPYVLSGTSPARQDTASPGVRFGMGNANLFGNPLVRQLAIGAAIVILLLGGWSLIRSKTGFGLRSVQAEDFRYTIEYSRNASKVDVEGVGYLEGKDPVTGLPMLMAVGKAPLVSNDCRPNGLNRVIDRPMIEDVPHNLCYSATMHTYVMNFTHNGEWYYLTVFPKDKTKEIEPQTAQRIAKSVKIQ